MKLRKNNELAIFTASSHHAQRAPDFPHRRQNSSAADNAVANATSHLPWPNRMQNALKGIMPEAERRRGVRTRSYYSEATVRQKREPSFVQGCSITLAIITHRIV
jgi:hypothetical protein